MKCSICGKEIKSDEKCLTPIVGVNCCNECNNKVVEPFKVLMSTLQKQNAALLITQDEARIYIPKDKYFTLKELQDAVEGNIELAPRIFDDYLTVVNEEGILKGLPFNTIAYKLFEVEYVGNVLICPDKIFEKPKE